MLCSTRATHSDIHRRCLYDKLRLAWHCVSSASDSAQSRPLPLAPSTRCTTTTTLGHVEAVLLPANFAPVRASTAAIDIAGAVSLEPLAGVAETRAFTRGALRRLGRFLFHSPARQARRRHRYADRRVLLLPLAATRPTSCTRASTNCTALHHLPGIHC